METDDDFFETPELESEEEGPRWREQARECIEAGTLTGEALQAFERFADRTWATPKIVAWIEREHERALQWLEDKALLDEVMATEKLREREQEAFSEWYEQQRPLTDAQRGWLQRVAERLGVA